jgi:hypothetical protein
MYISCCPVAWQMPSQAHSLLAMQRSYRSMKSALVAVAVEGGWKLELCPASNNAGPRWSHIGLEGVGM